MIAGFTRAALLGTLLLACSSRPAAKPAPVPSSPTPPTDAPVIHVPRTAQPIVIDGDTDEGPWRSGAFVTDPFADAHGKQAPFTTVSMVADNQALYLLVYVADKDLRSDSDRVTLSVGTLKIVLNPKGGDAPAGVRLAVDLDGTVDDPKDDDEEWVTEIAIPWTLLPPKPVPFRAVRIDTGGDEQHPRALAWPSETQALLAFP